MRHENDGCPRSQDAKHVWGEGGKCRLCGDDRLTKCVKWWGWFDENGLALPDLNGRGGCGVGHYAPIEYDEYGDQVWGTGEWVSTCRLGDAGHTAKCDRCSCGKKFIYP